MLKEFRYEQHCDMQDLITLTSKCVQFSYMMHTCRMHPRYPYIFIADISQRSSRAAGRARAVAGARSVGGVRAAQRFDMDSVSVTACACAKMPTPVCIDDGQDTPKVRYCRISQT